MIIKLKVLAFYIVGTIMSSSTAFINSNPDPKNKDTYSLFKIERSRDTNQVLYDINLNSEGKIDIKNPIRIYWIKHTMGGIEENLTWVQRKFGYGLKFIRANDSQVIFRFVSHINRDFSLKKNNEGYYKVYASSNNDIIEVNKLFIQFDGGTFLSPKVTKVELHGIDQKTHDHIIEIINP